MKATIRVRLSIPGSMLSRSDPRPRPGARTWHSAPAAVGSVWRLGCGSKICACLKVHPWIKATFCFSRAIACRPVLGAGICPALPGGICIGAWEQEKYLAAHPSPPIACFPVVFDQIYRCHVIYFSRIARSLVCHCFLLQLPGAEPREMLGEGLSAACREGGGWKFGLYMVAPPKNTSVVHNYSHPFCQEPSRA